MTNRRWGTGRPALGLALALALVACSSTPSPAPSTGPTTSTVPGSPGTTAEAGTSAGASASPTIEATALPTAAPSEAPATPTAAPTPTPVPPTPVPTKAPTPVPPAPTPTTTLGVLRVANVPSALAIANAHDGSGRLFVASQSGQLWVLVGGQRSAAPILDLTGRISTGGERGLLGIAFHPRFPSDPRLFVDYTDPSGTTVVSSFLVGGGGSGAVDAGSETVILRQAQPYANHNGGAIAFGPDGFLYIALGDGGSAGDPQGNGQRLDTLLAKILRIDVDAGSGSNNYAIPAGNPFVGQAGARPEIWLTGLRNPWRFSFDRATGDLWIGDVGQGTWEEVDVARAGVGGLNFGWNRTEGFHCYAPASGCNTAGLSQPVAEYAHGSRCSISGGYVYRGSAIPGLRGRYLFGDYCSGEILSIVAAGEGRREPVVGGAFGQGLSAFGEDEAGEVYVANVSQGWVGRVIP